MCHICWPLVPFCFNPSSWTTDRNPWPGLWTLARGAGSPRGLVTQWDPTSWEPTLHDSTRDCRNLRKTVEFGKATSEYPVHFTFEPPLCLSGSDAIRWATDGKRKVRLTWHAYHPCGSRNQQNLLSTRKTPPLTSFQSVGPNHCYLNSRVISNDFVRVIADKLWSKLRLIQKQACQSGSLSSQWSFDSQVKFILEVEVVPVWSTQSKPQHQYNCTQVQTIVEPSFLRRSPSQELFSAGRKDFIPLLPCLDGLTWSWNILTVEGSVILHQLRLVILLCRIQVVTSPKDAGLDIKSITRRDGFDRIRTGSDWVYQSYGAITLEASFPFAMV